jgi:hypothetical protein
MLRSVDWWLVIGISGKPIGPIFKHVGPSVCPETLKMGPIGFPEASVDNHQSTLRNIPEE